jgi:hypothetical protein
MWLHLQLSAARRWVAPAVLATQWLEAFFVQLQATGRAVSAAATRQRSS